jgi:3-dehydroquinate dehydratase-2
MSKLIYILNGPNLNLLGKRQPEIYGSSTLEDVEQNCRTILKEGYDVRLLQSNYEGQLIDWVHEAREQACGIVINPAAFTHTSVALLDALHTFEGPVIEVHISNVHQRESFRHHSYVSLRAEGVIAGLGIEGYEAAVRRVMTLTASS